MNAWSIVVAIAESISAVLAGVAIVMTVRISAKQRRLEQRQLILPLWGYLQDLDRIDPDKPVWPDVVKAVNRLELIAICWEGDMVEKDIIRRMYADLYIEIYQSIDECKSPPPSMGRTGKQMLLGCPAAMKLYQELIQEHSERNSLKPIN